MKNPANLGRSSGANGIKQGELFDPPEFCATYPNPASMTGKALTMLLQTPDGITTPDFQSVTKSWRLAAYVHELIRDYGWPIEVLEIHFSDDRSRFIAKYVMPRWVLREVGAAHG